MERLWRLILVQQPIQVDLIHRLYGYQQILVTLQGERSQLSSLSVTLMSFMHWFLL